MMNPVTERRCATTTLRTTICQLGIVTLVAATLSACGNSTPEARLEAVGEDLSDSTSQLDSLNTQIEETETMLDELRDDRRDLRDTVRTLEQRLEARATDVAIFRAVQSALLEDAMLSESAIAVNVEDGRVALTGVVRNKEEAQQALAVAKQIAGVDGVSSRIRVNDPAAPGPGGT